jgi:hypothetical protein
MAAGGGMADRLPGIKTKKQPKPSRRTWFGLLIVALGLAAKTQSMTLIHKTHAKSNPAPVF